MNMTKKIKVIERKLLKFFKDENTEGKNIASKKKPRESTTDKG